MNIKELKKYLSEFRLQELKDKSGVLFVGRTRTGKSTAIGVQLGAIYQRKKGKMEYELLHSSVKTPLTSRGFRSKTLNIQAHSTTYNNADMEEEIFYFDTAGFGENRSVEAKKWTQYCLSLLYATVREFRAVVVVLDYQLTMGRGEAPGLNLLSNDLAEISSGEEQFYNSTIFLVTNVLMDGLLISKQEIRERAAEIFEQLKRNRKERIEEINGRPAPRAGLVENIATSLTQVVVHAMTSEENRAPQEPQIRNPNSVTEEDREYLKTLHGQIKLLETFLDSKKDRIVLSNPDGTKACTKIRKELLDKILVAPAVTQEALHMIRRRHSPEGSFQLINATCSIAANYLETLKPLKEVLEKVDRFYSNIHSLLKSIDRNFKIVHDRLKEEQEKQLEHENTERQKNIQLRDALQDNGDDGYLFIQNIQQSLTTSFFFIEYLFGMLRTTYPYSYEGHAFSRVERRAHLDVASYDCSNETIDSAGGRYNATFTSRNGKDLDLSVIFYLPIKDLPETIRSIHDYNIRIQKSAEKIVQINEKKLAIETTNNATELLEVVTLDIREDRDQIDAQFSALNACVDNENGATEWQAIKGIVALFSFHTPDNPLHFGLSPANLNLIDEFVKCVSIIEKLSKNPYLKTQIPELDIYLKSIVEVSSEEPTETDCERLTKSIRACCSSVAGMFPNRSEGGEAGYNQIGSNNSHTATAGQGVAIAATLNTGDCCANAQCIIS